MLKKVFYSVLTAAVLASPFLMSFFPGTNRYELIRGLGPLVILGFGVLLWAFVRGWKDAHKPSSRPLLLLLLGFLMASALSMLNSSIWQFGFAELFVLLVSSLIYLVFSQEKTWSIKLTWALGLTLIAATVLGIPAYLNTDHTRFFGFFYDPLIKADAWPNAYADFFLLSAPFLVLLFTRSRRAWILKVLVLSLVLAGFVLTGSRGAFLALFPALVFFCAAQVWNGYSLKKNWALIVLAVLVVPLTWGSTLVLQNLKEKDSLAVNLGDRLSFQEMEGGNSVNERVEFFEGALNIIQEHPLLGTGPSSFRFEYQPYQQGFLALSDHPHNLWLKLAAERGIPAAFFLLCFLLVLFFYTHPFRKASSEEQFFRLAAWTGLVAFLAHQMIDYNLNFLTNMLTLWMILGALAAHVSASKTRWVPFTYFALVVLLTVSGLKLTYDELHFNRLAGIESIQAFEPVLPSYEWYEKIGSTDDSTLKTVFIRKQLEANPMDSTMWFLLGSEEEKRGDFASARLAYETGLKANPKNTFLGYVGLARVLLQQNDTAALMDLSVRLTPLFEEYQKLYDLNLHFTQSTQEMQLVKELKDMFGVKID